MCTGRQKCTPRQAWAHSVHTETYPRHKCVHVTGMPMKYMNDFHATDSSEVKQTVKVIQRKRSIYEFIYTQMCARTHTRSYIDRQECCEYSFHNASRLRAVVFNN